MKSSSHSTSTTASTRGQNSHANVTSSATSRRTRLARAALFAAAAIATTGPSLTPSLSAYWSANINFSGNKNAAGMVGLAHPDAIAGAVPTTAKYWSDFNGGSGTNQVVRTQLGDAFLDTGIRMTWTSQGGGYGQDNGGGGDTAGSSANTRLLAGYIDDSGATRQNVTISGIYSALDVTEWNTTYDVYVICWQDGSNPRNKGNFLVNSTAYYGVPNGTEPGANAWSASRNYSGTILVQGAGGQYLKITTSGDTLTVVGANQERTGIAGLQVTPTAYSGNFAHWSAGAVGTWDTAATDWKLGPALVTPDANTAVSAWNNSNANTVALFTSSASVTLTGTVNLSEGLWAKSGDVVLSGGTLNLVNSLVRTNPGASLALAGTSLTGTGNIANNGTLVISGTVTNSVPIAGTGTLELSGAGTVFTQNANITLGLLTGEGKLTRTTTGNALLTFGVGNVSGFSDASIVNGAGKIRVDKTGTGTINLSGAKSTAVGYLQAGESGGNWENWNGNFDQRTSFYIGAGTVEVGEWTTLGAGDERLNPFGPTYANLSTSNKDLLVSGPNADTLGLYGPFGPNVVNSTAGSTRNDVIPMRTVNNRIFIAAGAKFIYSGSGPAVLDRLIQTQGSTRSEINIPNASATLFVAELLSWSGSNASPSPNMLRKTGPGTLFIGGYGMEYVTDGSGTLGGGYVTRGKYGVDGSLLGMNILEGEVVLARPGITGNSGNDWGHYNIYVTGGVLRLGSAAEGNTNSDQFSDRRTSDNDARLWLSGGTFNMNGMTETIRRLQNKTNHSTGYVTGGTVIDTTTTLPTLKAATLISNVDWGVDSDDGGLGGRVMDYTNVKIRNILTDSNNNATFILRDGDSAVLHNGADVGTGNSSRIFVYKGNTALIFDRSDDYELAADLTGGTGGRYTDVSLPINNIFIEKRGSGTLTMKLWNAADYGTAVTNSANTTYTRVFDNGTLRAGKNNVFNRTNIEVYDEAIFSLNNTTQTLFGITMEPGGKTINEVVTSLVPVIDGGVQIGNNINEDFLDIATDAEKLLVAQGRYLTKETGTSHTSSGTTLDLGTGTLNLIKPAGGKVQNLHILKGSGAININTAITVNITGDSPAFTGTVGTSTGSTLNLSGAIGEITAATGGVKVAGTNNKLFLSAASLGKLEVAANATGTATLKHGATLGDFSIGSGAVYSLAFSGRNTSNFSTPAATFLQLSNIAGTVTFDVASILTSGANTGDTVALFDYSGSTDTELAATWESANAALAAGHWQVAGAAGMRPDALTLKNTSTGTGTGSFSVTIGDLYSLTWAETGTGTWTTGNASASNWQRNSGGVFAEQFYTNDLISFKDKSESGDTVTGSVSVAAVVSPARIVVENSSLAYTFTSSNSGKIDGVTSLIKRGSGTLNMNLANTYVGGTVIEGGTLKIGNATALGTGTIELKNSSLLDVTGYEGITNNVFVDEGQTGIVKSTTNSSKIYTTYTGTGTVKLYVQADASFGVASPDFAGTFELNANLLTTKYRLNIANADWRNASFYLPDNASSNGGNYSIEADQSANIKNFIFGGRGYLYVGNDKILSVDTVIRLNNTGYGAADGNNGIRQGNGNSRITSSRADGVLTFVNNDPDTQLLLAVGTGNQSPASIETTVVKEGLGILAVTQPFRHTGGTIVNEGTVIVGNLTVPTAGSNDDRKGWIGYGQVTVNPKGTLWLFGYSVNNDTNTNPLNFSVVLNGDNVNRGKLGANGYSRLSDITLNGGELHALESYVGERWGVWNIRDTVKVTANGTYAESAAPDAAQLPYSNDHPLISYITSTKGSSPGEGIRLGYYGSVGNGLFNFDVADGAKLVVQAGLHDDGWNDAGTLNGNNFNSGIRKTGTGVMVLDKHPTYTFVAANDTTAQYRGATIVEAGKLIIARLSQSASFTVDNAGSVLEIADGASGNVTAAPYFLVGAETLLSITRATPLVLTSNISGAGKLIKTNTGTLTLSGGNSHTGGTIIAQGTLILSNDANLGGIYDTVTAPNATLTLGDNTAQTTATLQFSVANVALAHPVLLAAGSTINTNGFNATISGKLADAPDSTSTGTVPVLTKTGAGTLTLSGTNSYTGATVITTGRLIAGAADVFSSTSAISLGSNTKLDIGRFDQSIRKLSTTSNAEILVGSGATLSLAIATDTQTISGAITGAGGVAQTGAGKTVLSGTNTFTGALTLTAGTVSVATAANLGADSASLVFNGGTLEVTNAFDFSARVGVITVNDVAGGSFITSGSGVANTITFGDLAGIGKLTNSGAGLLKVDSFATGKIASAKLSVAAGGSLLAASGVTSLSVHGEALTDTAPAPVTLGSLNADSLEGVAFNIRVGTVAGVADSFDIGSTAALALGDATDAAHTTSVNFSDWLPGTTPYTVVTAALGFTGDADDVVVSIAGIAATVHQGFETTIDTSGTPALLVGLYNKSAELTWAGTDTDTGAGAWNATPANTPWVDVRSGENFFVDGDKVLFDATGSPDSETAAAVSLGTTSRTVSDLAISGGNYAFTGAALTGRANAAIGGSLASPAGALIVSGGATVSFANALNFESVSFSGTATGVSLDTTASLVTTGALAVESGAALTLSANGQISAAALAFDGATLATTATVTLPVAIPVAIGADGVTFDTAAETTLALGNVLSDSASAGTLPRLTKTGAGTLVLSGNNTYTGGTTLLEGTLEVSTVANLGANDAANTLTLGIGTPNAPAPTFVASGTTPLALDARTVAVAASGVVLDIRADSPLVLTADLTNTNTSSPLITKRGEGTLNLTSTAKSFRGTLAVSEGELNLGVENAVPNVSLALSGAGAAIATQSQTFTSLSIASGNSFSFSASNSDSARRNLTTGGLVLNGQLDGVNNFTLTDDGEFTVAEGKSLETTGTVTFGEKSRINLNSAHAIAAGSLVFNGTGDDRPVINVVGYYGQTDYVIATSATDILGEWRSTLLLNDIQQEVPLTLDENSYLKIVIEKDATNKAIHVLSSLVRDFDTGGAHGSYSIPGSSTFTIGAVPGIGAVITDNSTVVSDPSLAFAGSNWDGKSLTKRGTGTLNLASANSYTGTTTIEEGRLIAHDIASTGEGIAPVTIGEDGTFEIALDSAHGGDFAKPLSGNGAFEKTGTGNLTLTAAPGTTPFSGSTLVTGGTLALSGPASLAASSGVTLAAETIVSAPKFDISAIDEAATSVAALVTDSRSVVVLGEKSLAVGSGNIAGIITSGSSRSLLRTAVPPRLIKTTSGTLTLSGSNTYTGNTRLEGGTLVLANNHALSTGTLEHAAAAATGALELGNALVVANDIQLDGTGSRAIAVPVGSATLTGTLTNAGSATDFVKAGAGTLILNSSAALAAFTGGLEIADGILQISAPALNNALSGSGTLAVGLAAPDAVFTLGANSGAAFTGKLDLVQGALPLSGSTAAALASATLHLNKNSSATVGVSTTLASLELGGGELRFTAAPISPAAILSVGTLDLSAGGTVFVEGLETVLPAALPDIAQNLLDYWGNTNTAAIRLVEAASVTPVASGKTLVWKPTGSAQSRPLANGQGTATFDFAPTATDTGIYLDYRLARIEAAPSATAVLDANTGSGDPRMEAKLTGAGGFKFIGSSATQVIPVAPAAPGVVNDYTGDTFVQSVTVRLDADSALGAAAALSLLNGGTVDFAGHAQSVTRLSGAAGTTLLLGDFSVQSGDFAGSILTSTNAPAGAENALRKTGAGTLTLSGDTKFDGLLSVSGGALVLRGALQGETAAANDFTGPVALEGGSLVVERAGAQTFSGVLSGTGSLVKQSAGTTTLSGANTFTGQLTVNAGALVVSGALGVPPAATGLPAAATYPAAIRLADGATLTFDQSVTKQTLTGVLSGAGELVKDGSATLTLTAANTFTGDINVKGGVLEINGAIGYNVGRFDYSGAIAIESGAELSFSQSGNQILRGDLTGSGTLTRKGRGTLTLATTTALTGYTGAFKIESGRLEFTAAAGATTTIQNTLRGSGTLAAGFTSATSRLVLEAGAGEGFAGTVELPKGILAFSDANPAALRHATVSLGRDATVNVSPGANIGSLVANGGTITLTSGDPLFVGTLDITGDVHLVAPVDVTLPDSGTSLFDFWQGEAASQILVISANSVSGSRSNILWGNSQNAASSKSLNGADGTPAGTAQFDYAGSVKSIGSARGVYIGYGLQKITTDAGKDVVLDATGADDAALFAKLTGAGAFTFTGAAGQVIRLGNEESDYTGGTTLRTATLALADGNAFGAAAPLALQDGAVLDLNGISTAITVLTGEAGTRVIPASGSTLTVQSGAFAGAFNGTSAHLTTGVPGALIKTGADTLALTDSTATHALGALRVEAGTLDIAGSLVTGELVNSAILNAAALTTGSALENNGVLTATTLNGGILNRGEAVISGQLTAPAGARVENSGALSAAVISAENISNTGLLSLRTVNGDLLNATSGQIHLAASGPALHEINGNFKNDGLVYFADFGHTFRVANLANVSASGVGYYNLEVNFSDPAQSDRVVVDANGRVTGRHEFIVRNSVGVVSRDSSVVVLEGNIAAGSKIAVHGLTSTGAVSPKAGVDVGAYVFDFEIDPATGASTGRLVAGAPSGAASAAIGSTGMLASGWFSQLDNLSKRLGELRIPQNNAAATAKSAKAAASTSVASAASNDIWLRAYAGQLNADLQVAQMSRILAHQYGADIGADHAFALDNATLYLGATLGYQTTRLRFRDSAGARGDTDSFVAGIYATYLHNSGYYADAIIKGQSFDNEYRSDSARGDFDDLGVGFSLELGKRIALGDAWFAEPSVQVDYTHLLTKDYDLTGSAPTEVNTADSDVFRFVQAVRVGRVWDLGDGAFIQPAARFGLEEQTSSGGRMRINSDPGFRPNTDGLRGIVGIGISWQFTPVQQIHFDYESSFGDKVDRPWALNAGYRLRF